MGAATHVLIIDADSLIRDGLTALLNMEEGLQVIGAISTSSEIARVPLPTAPDLVILDIAIPDYTDQTVAAVRGRWPDARILVLTFERDEQALKAALRAGVDAYLLKSDTRSELMTALHHLKEGKDFVSPGIAEQVANGRPTRHPVGTTGPAGLSDRERDVLKRVAQGRRTREIAQELSLSHKTVEKYRSNLMRKLGLKSATAVVAYAITHGYVEI